MEEETGAGRVEGTDDRPRDRLRCVLLFVRRRRRCVCVPTRKGREGGHFRKFLTKDRHLCIYGLESSLSAYIRSTLA